MGVGIEAINAYVGKACVDVRTLFGERGLDTTRFDNLMMDQRSVNLPCEDPVTNAVNAARPLVEALSQAERDRVELLVVATESGLDLGKSLSTYVHHYLGLGANCRSFEVKHACYGGTAALQTAAGIVAANPRTGTKALVVATDAPSASSKGTYWEPSEGGGAVAMLVSAQPDILDLDAGANGFHTFEVMDTARPRADLDLVDSDVSMLAYLKCLEECVLDYQRRVTGADVMASFDYLVLHTPFAGMVKGAHRTLLRRQKRASSDLIERDFQARVAPSLVYASRVGNLFSAALYLALCSLLEHGTFDEEQRIGLFSYGSGCASELFSGVVGTGAADRLARHRVAAAIEDRFELTVQEYDSLIELGAARDFGVREAEFDTASYRAVFDAHFAGRGLLVLDRIANFHREYRWS